MSQTQYPILPAQVILPEKLQAGAPQQLAAWHKPLAEPVLPKLGLAAAILAGSFFMDPTALAEAGSPTHEIYYPPLSEPVLPPERLLTANEWSFELDPEALATAGSPPAPSLMLETEVPGGIIQIQSQGLAEPIPIEVVAPPAPDITYPPLAEPVLPAARLQTASQWSFTVDDSLLATGGSPHLEIYRPPFSEPVLPAERLLTANQRAFWLDHEALATESDPQDTHYPPLSEPVLPAPRPVDTDPYYSVDPALLAEGGSPALEVTYPPLSEPVLPAPRLLAAISAGSFHFGAEPADFVEPPHNFPDWYAPLAEPVIKPEYLTALQWSFEVDPDLLATGGNPPLGDPALEIKRLPLSEPVLPADRLQTANEWSFELDPAALATAGSPTYEIHYPPLSEPVLPAERLLTALQRAFWLDREALATESDPQDTHYPPLSEPTLPAPRLLTALQWSFQVDPDLLATGGTPPPFDPAAQVFPPFSLPLPPPVLPEAVRASGWQNPATDPGDFVEPPAAAPDFMPIYRPRRRG
jgi:hypothetical protein